MISASLEPRIMGARGGEGTPVDKIEKGSYEPLIMTPHRVEKLSPKSKSAKNRIAKATDDLAIVQKVARELCDGKIRGSLTRLSTISRISLDALRMYKRKPGTSSARTLPPARQRLLAILVAAHREGVLEELLEAVEEIEREWRRGSKGK